MMSVAQKKRDVYLEHVMVNAKNRTKEIKLGNLLSSNGNYWQRFHFSVYLLGLQGRAVLVAC